MGSDTARAVAGDCDRGRGMAEVARQLRGSLLELLSSQYVRTLHAKGLSMTRILWQHGLKNVSVNLFTIISVLVNRMLAATVVIEAVFAIPGMGSLIVHGAVHRDFPIVQGVVFTMVMIVILVNLIADALCRGRSEGRVMSDGRRTLATVHAPAGLVPLAATPAPPPAVPARGGAAVGCRAADRAVFAHGAGLDQYAGRFVRRALLGTDDLGRDVLSRLIHGAAASLFSSFLRLASQWCLGVPVGLLAGFLGGWVDE